jgi:hypothetical protein
MIANIASIRAGKRKYGNVNKQGKMGILMSAKSRSTREPREDGITGWIVSRTLRPPDHYRGFHRPM